MGLYWGISFVGVWLVAVWVLWFLVVGLFFVWWLFAIYECSPRCFFVLEGGGLLIVYRITSIFAAVFLSVSGSSVKMSSVSCRLTLWRPTYVYSFS